MQKQKQKQRIWNRISLSLLMTSSLLALVYLKFGHRSTLRLGNIDINFKIIILSVLGLIFGLSLLSYWYWQSQTKSHRYWQIVRHNLLQNQYIYFFQKHFKTLFGLSLLCIALIIQANPSLVTGPIYNIWVQKSHNPVPPLIKSPWPWNHQATLHPMVTHIPPEIETSIQSVAQYIAHQEPDSYLRVKALHDYVIYRVTYDLDVLVGKGRPSQDAQTVFLTRKGVCEGYARLFMALAKAIDLDVVYLKGQIRRDQAPVDVIPKTFRLLKSNYDWTLHAWNAVKVEGQWQLVDTTWDDRDSPAFTYSADYLMPAPAVMIKSHFPEEPVWQLLTQPQTYENFEKQPLLMPQFFKDNLEMITPTKYPETVGKMAWIEINHPPDYPKQVAAIFAKRQESGLAIWDLPEGNPFKVNGKTTTHQCQSVRLSATKSQISCQFPDAGDYQVLLFSLNWVSPMPSRTTSAIGQLRFNAL